MKLLKLHSNGKQVYINADNITAIGWNNENGKVNLITNYLKGIRIEVDEPLFEINKQWGDSGASNQRDSK